MTEWNDEFNDEDQNSYSVAMYKELPDSGLLVKDIKPNSLSTTGPTTVS